MVDKALTESKELIPVGYGVAWEDGVVTMHRTLETAEEFAGDYYGGDGLAATVVKLYAEVV